MNLKQNGLRRRVGIEARRISSQHRQLDQFYGMLAEALRRERPADARSAFQRFRDALEAHFTMEDEIHFPALHGLRPDLEAQLSALVAEHRDFRQQLETLQGQFDRSELGPGAEVLDDFVTRLAAHEGREEKLLADLPASPTR